MKIADLRSKSTDELQAFVVEKRAELVEKRRSLANGELVNPQVIKVIRRDIARSLTLLQQQSAAAKKEES